VLAVPAPFGEPGKLALVAEAEPCLGRTTPFQVVRLGERACSPGTLRGAGEARVSSRGRTLSGGGPLLSASKTWRTCWQIGTLRGAGKLASVAEAERGWGMPLLRVGFPRPEVRLGERAGRSAPFGEPGSWR
jgi:hypothetical protein